MERAFSIGLTIFVVIMSTVIMILGYQIEGCNTTVLWCIFLPLVIVRTIRAILLINIKTNKHEKIN